MILTILNSKYIEHVPEFGIPMDLKIPLRYSANTLKACELNRDATNDSR
jgi:hypothetical protein